MPRRPWLALLPLPVLAVFLAISACSGSRTDEPAVHVIPPAAALAPAPAAPTAPAASAAEDQPSEEEVRAFERPVPK
jgi:hypothetical protein